MAAVKDSKFFVSSRLSENIRETPEGYLLCLGVPIARTGWQDYGPGETPLEVGDEGVVWIYRDAKEVFKPQTVASFNGKSVTIKHPNDFVDPKNWKILTHGTVQNVRKGDEKDDDGEEQLLADLLITDEIAIGLVQNGLREVSCGYECEYEEDDDGTGRQVRIIGNHVALVEQGRAGTAYAIRDEARKANEMKALKAAMEQLKAFGKTVDHAVEEKAKADKLKKKKSAKDEKAKDKKAKDAAPEQVSYDDLFKGMTDLQEKVIALAGGKNDKTHIGDDEEEMEEKSKDEDMDDEDMDDSDEMDETGQNSRLDKLEAAVAKILERLGSGDEDEEESKDADEDESEDSDEEESEDDDMVGDEDEEMEDADEDESEDSDMEGEEGENSQKKTGDAAHIEILTPGKKFKGKDARIQCLKVFSKTEDGKKLLKLMGLEKPTFDSKNSDLIFLAAANLVKSKRGNGLKGTKDQSVKANDSEESEDGVMTAAKGMSAEQQNEFNAKHYGAMKK